MVDTTWATAPSAGPNDDVVVPTEQTGELPGMHHKKRIVKMM